MLAVLSGCAGGADEPELDAASSSARLDAIADHEEVPEADYLAELVQSLRSDDPLLRAVAIHELKGHTGQTLGYVADDPEDRREAAVERWERWLEDRGRRANTSAGADRGSGGSSAQAGGVEASPDTH